MDILSHGLWASAAAQGVNFSPRLHIRLKRKLSVPWTFFWGVFPDLFAFTAPFAWMIWQVVTGHANFSEFRPPQEPAAPDTLPMFHLASSLYNISHSLVIFFVFFAVGSLVMRRLIWEMFGALLHILSDIPTHAYTFFPTPFLWPLSDIKVNGFSWGTPWFLLLDYSLLIVIYTLLYRKKKKLA
jgi:hypothetical protein